MSPIEGEGSRKSPSPGTQSEQLRFQLALRASFQLNAGLFSNPGIAFARATGRIERNWKRELCQGFEIGNALQYELLALQFGGPGYKRKMIIAAPPCRRTPSTIGRFRND